MQSSNGGLHVALIPDGNGRWAEARGLPRSEGHRAGIEAVRRAVEAAPGLGIRTFTLFAFSAENWQRPAAEVANLMGIFESYLREAAPRAVEHDVRISILGRRSRLPGDLPAAIAEAERATRHGRRMHFRLAVDYSARDEILRAAEQVDVRRPSTREDFSRLLAPDQPAPVDLLIRTAGDLRLSDFLLWECAYAELYFSPRLWPDFSVADFEAALADFHGRERRFGRLPELAAV
ncbi:MAG: polyprenyl diphosphate synthase [Candidatus Acidiferrales bacterium]